MTPRTCPRCHSTLHTEDATSLVFCWSCGAPQITLSEELQEQFAQQRLNAQTGGAVALPVEPGTDPNGVLWSRAIQLAGLAGAVIVLLSVVMAAFPNASLPALLALFWGIGSPIILLVIYCARTPLTRVTTGFGAQLGLFSGLSIAIAAVSMQTIVLLLKRFAFHKGAEIDASFDTVFSGLQAQMTAQATASADVATMRQMFHWFTVPEFRIGLLLTGAFSFVCFYLIYAALAGAFAGFLRSRARRS